MDAFGAQPSCVDASDARVQEVAEAVGSVIGEYVIADADRYLVKSCKDVIDKGFCGITAETDWNAANVRSRKDPNAVRYKGLYVGMTVIPE